MLNTSKFVSDGLYTKITGGQRVDLFGAQKQDLPDIWEELVDAGFESGHAYGESPNDGRKRVFTTDAGR